jgi:hypothetical protein
LKGRNVEVTNAKYIRDDDGYALLLLDIDGETVVFDAYQKQTLLDMGYVSLGGGPFRGKPEFTFQVTPPGGAPLTLNGYTQDPRVRNYYDSFRKAVNSGTFKEGAAIP